MKRFIHKKTQNLCKGSKIQKLMKQHPIWVNTFCYGPFNVHKQETGRALFRKHIILTGLYRRPSQDGKCTFVIKTPKWPESVKKRKTYWVFLVEPNTLLNSSWTTNTWWEIFSNYPKYFCRFFYIYEPFFFKNLNKLL